MYFTLMIEKIAHVSFFCSDLFHFSKIQALLLTWTILSQLQHLAQ